jgi:hypothetical protein
MWHDFRKFVARGNVRSYNQLLERMSTQGVEEAAPAPEPTLCPHCRFEIPPGATRCGHCTATLEGAAY